MQKQQEEAQLAQAAAEEKEQQHYVYKDESTYVSELSALKAKLVQLKLQKNLNREKLRKQDPKVDLKTNPDYIQIRNDLRTINTRIGIMEEAKNTALGISDDSDSDTDTDSDEEEEVHIKNPVWKTPVQASGDTRSSEQGVPKRILEQDSLGAAAALLLKAGKDDKAALLLLQLLSMQKPDE